MRTRITPVAGEAAALEARRLVAHSLGCEPVDLVRVQTISEDVLVHLNPLVCRRAEGEPLAHITAEVGFWTLNLRAGPQALIPRADSETLVQAALDSVFAQPLRLLDLGTGTGALLLALLSEWPETFGVGVDRSEPALALARLNAERNGLEGRSAFVCSNWAEALSPASFEVVVANPPYIPTSQYKMLEPQVREFEPRQALDAGFDGLDAHRAIADALPRLLTRNGRFYIEVGWDQAKRASPLYNDGQLRLDTVINDLGGRQRVLQGTRL